MLLTLLDRMVEEARENRGEALERFTEDPPRWLRQAITAIYETFRSHRAVSLAGADARATSAEVRDLWARVMEGFVVETTAAIEAERARGAAPDGVPARDLAIALNSMNERVLQATFAGHAPAIDEEHVVDVLLSRVARRHLRRRVNPAASSDPAWALPGTRGRMTSRARRSSPGPRMCSHGSTASRRMPPCWTSVAAPAA